MAGGEGRDWERLIRGWTVTYFVLTLTVILLLTWASVLTASSVTFLHPSQKKPNAGDHSALSLASHKYVDGNGAYQQ